MKIHPAQRIRGRLHLPGDKSISHRAALLSALAQGDSRLTNYSTAADCASTLDCLRQLGVQIEREGTNVRVKGVGPRGLRASASPLDCGNSGSTMRLLAGVLAGQSFVSVLTGDDSLRSRPMKRVIEPLELMGARITSTAARAPLQITGHSPLAPIRYETPVASAQVKSCILLAGLNAQGRTEVIESHGATRDHTERMLRWLGVSVEESVQMGQGGVSSRSLSIEGPGHLSARDISIPGDISSAAFFIAAASLLPGSELEISGVGLNETRAQIVNTMRLMGAGVRVTNRHEECNETVGDLSIRAEQGVAAQNGGPNILSGALIPQLIDELPVLAVVGSQTAGGLTIRDAKELRVKESDRIAATAENLRAMGAEVEEHEDGMTIQGRAQLHGARIKTHGDHRIAMAFTVAALVAEGASELDDAACVSISFPEFFELLESVIER